MINIKTDSFKNFLSYFIPAWHTLKNVPTSYVKMAGFNSCSPVHINIPLQVLLAVISTIRVTLITSCDTHQKMQEELNQPKAMNKEEKEAFKKISQLVNQKNIENDRLFFLWLFYKDRERGKVFLGEDLFSSQIEDEEKINKQVKEKYFSQITPLILNEMSESFEENGLEQLYVDFRMNLLYRELLLKELHGKNERRCVKMAKIISYTNAIVFSSFSGYMMWLFIAAFTSLLWWIAIPTILTVIATWYVSIHFGGSAIKRQFGKFGYYLDNPSRLQPRQILHGIAAFSAVTTAPLLYMSFSHILIPLLLNLGIIAAVANPVGACIVGIFIAISVVASISLVFSQMDKIKKSYTELCGKDSELRKDYEEKGLYGLFVASIVLGVLFSIAAIGIAVVGDIFGFQKTFSVGLLASYAMKAGFFTMSLIYNTMYTFADTTVKMAKSSLCFFNWVSGSVEKKNSLTSSSSSFTGLFAARC